MNFLHSIFIVMLTIFASANVFSASYKCDGMDGESNAIHAIYDEDADTININGTTLQITASTKGKNGVATQDYARDDGTKVYASLVTEGKNKIVLRQLRSTDDEELSVVTMHCE